MRKLGLTVLVCFGLGSVASADDQLSLRDLFELESISDPQISPDGRRIVYVRGFADILSDRFYSNLWIIDVDGSNHRPLTTGRQNDSSARWSLDGERLAYISTQEESAQIWIRYMDTGQTAKLTHHEHSPSGLTWSPDGSQLAFTALVAAKAPEIAELVPAPPGAEWAEPAKVIDRLYYRFDPVGNLPRGDWKIFVVPAEGGTARQVTRGEGSFGGPGLGRGGSPVWSPDGKSLLISANLRPESDLEPLDTEIWEIDLATGAARALTDRRGPDGEVVVSPAGDKIAYIGFDDRYQGYQLSHLYVANRDGSQPRALSPALGRSPASPRFSADGSHIFFTYVSEGRNRLASVLLDGEITDHVDDVGGGMSAYANSSGFSIAANGNFAVVLSDPRSPGRLAVGTIGGTTRSLAEVNGDVLGHKELAEMEEIWFDSSHDGRKVQGWILKPPDFDPGRQYPLILEIHGGPFAAYGPRWDTEKQLMAAAGYIVLYTNPRGSTSYGEEFGNLIHHDYPGDDFHDLMSGVEAVIAKGYVDPDQLFVTGGSGGGVLTSWVIGRSDRFRAAVTVYPVINWYSWVLSTDIPAFGLKYWFPGFPWDHAEHYESRSLLSVVKNVKTPTMVLTGENDYRTPMSESEQYYTALKLLDVESVLVRVPDESHGIRRRPSHWMQKIAYIIGWMDKHR